MIELIVERLVKASENVESDLNNLLDKEAISEYVAHEDTSLNLLFLAVKHKNSALLEMIRNNYLSAFGSSKILLEKIRNNKKPGNIKHGDAAKSPYF